MNGKKSAWARAITYIVLAILVPLGITNPAVVGAVSSIGEQIAEHIESKERALQLGEGVKREEKLDGH